LIGGGHGAVQSWRCVQRDDERESFSCGESKAVNRSDAAASSGSDSGSIQGNQRHLDVLADAVLIDDE